MAELTRPRPFPAETAVEAVHLGKAYGSNEALRGVSLRVGVGEIVGYIGANGAGKTTTVRILLGLIADYMGEANVLGVDPRTDPVEVRRRIGYVPETPALYDALTTAEHLTLVGRAHGLPDAQIRERGDFVLESLGLADRRESAIGGLSKGMRQKLMLASAILHKPRFLVLDEPLSGLDALSSSYLRDFLLDFGNAGGAVLYCSHALEVVEQLCHRVYVLQTGQVMAEGDVDEVLSGEDRNLTAVLRRLAESTDQPPVTPLIGLWE